MPGTSARRKARLRRSARESSIVIGAQGIKTLKPKAGACRTTGRTTDRQLSMLNFPAAPQTPRSENVQNSGDEIFRRRSSVGSLSFVNSAAAGKGCSARAAVEAPAEALE